MIRKIVSAGKTFKTGSIAILIFLVLVAGGTYVAVKKLEKQVRQDVENSLKTVLNTTHEAQKIWIENNMDLLQVLTTDPSVIFATAELVNSGKDGDELQNRKLWEELKSQVLPKLHIFGHLDFMVMGPDNTLLGSASESDVFWSRVITTQRPESLRRAISGKKVLILPIDGNDPGIALPDNNSNSMMFFAGPIIKDGRPIAVLIFKVDPTYEFTHITQIGRIGNTGESYSFDRNSRMITNSRFTAQLHKAGLIETNQKAMLNIHICDPGENLLKVHQLPDGKEEHPLTFMAGEAIQGRPGANVEGYRDYRGVRVLGTWLWDNDLGYGLTTEIDEAEAMKSFNTKQYLVLGLMGLAVLATIALMRIIYKLEERTVEAEIKALKGMLPICAYCKKIRDDKGYWDQIESYIRARSDAEFSHSICPECAEKLYPDSFKTGKTL